MDIHSDTVALATIINGIISKSAYGFKVTEVVQKGMDVLVEMKKRLEQAS